MKLTEAERIARKHFLLLLTESTQSECNAELYDTQLPPWFDEAKYKRGQKFYVDNNYAVFAALFSGFIACIADNRGLKIIASTGKSSTKETAGLRYLTTLIHLLKWVETVLAPNSEALKSFDKVRKIHIIYSISTKENGLGGIKQFELLLTAFGFYGFVIFRPHFFGMKYSANSQEDREGFIHFWAIVSRMIGIRDKYNICLLPFDVLEVLSQMIFRYVLMPLMQTQTPLHKQMMRALIEGFSKYLSFPLEYESQIFATKMICGVPGYQYKCDLNNEIFSRSDILNEKDINNCNEILKNCMGEDYFEITYDMPVPITENGAIKLKHVNYENDWKYYLNDSKFSEMSWKAKIHIIVRHYVNKLYEYSVFKYLIECLISRDMSLIPRDI